MDAEASSHLWEQVIVARTGDHNIWRKEWTPIADQISALAESSILPRRASLRNELLEVGSSLCRRIALDVPHGCRFYVALVEYLAFVQSHEAGLADRKNKRSL